MLGSCNEMAKFWCFAEILRQFVGLTACPPYRPSSLFFKRAKTCLIV
jgi:hypothetical protein